MCHSRGSVSSLLSFSLLILCRGTSRNWSVLAFRFATLPSPPIPGYVTYTNVGGHYFFMKILPIVILLTTVQFASGQSQNQRDLVEILNVALRTDKLPTELIHKSVPKYAQWTNSPFIIVKSDTTKNLDREFRPTDNSNVWIVDYPEIFELALTCGLVPLNLKRKKNRLTLDYKTVKYPDSSKANTDMACHSGRLTAEKKGDSWTIVNSKTQEIKCEIDFFGHKK